MSLLDTMHHPEKYGKTLLKWGSLGILVGILGGLIGAGFHHVLHFVTQLRLSHPWVLFLLPLGGLLTLGIYRLFRLRNNRGTNEVIDAILNDGTVSPAVAPAIFLATAITHFLGGSAGREGAALQLGGSTASLLGSLLKLKENEHAVLTMAGMAAGVFGLVGTPPPAPPAGAGEEGGALPFRPAGGRVAGAARGPQDLPRRQRRREHGQHSRQHQNHPLFPRFH